MSNSIFRKFAVATLTAGLLTGAGSAAAFATENQAPAKSATLENINFYLSHGQSFENFNLLENYGNGIDRKSVLFGNGANEMRFEGVGTFVNHFDADGNYTGTSYLDDPNVDATGVMDLQVPFGVTNQVTYHNGGAFSSRVYNTVNLKLDDLATHTDAPSEAPEAVEVEGEGGMVLESPVLIGAAAAAGPANPSAPDETPIQEEETPAEEIEAPVAPEAPAVEIVEDSGTLVVTEEAPVVTSDGGSGMNLSTETQQETVREPLADTAVTTKSNNVLGGIITSVLASLAFAATFIGYKKKNAFNN